MHVVEKHVRDGAQTRAPRRSASDLPDKKRNRNKLKTSCASVGTGACSPNTKRNLRTSTRPLIGESIKNARPVHRRNNQQY